jgi:hypothetical protein
MMQSTAATRSPQTTPIQPPQAGPVSNPNPSIPAQLEADVRKLSADLDKAEDNAEKTGREFGQKLIELRDLRKKDKRADWMAYLDQVVKVKYEKARYWINVVEGKSNHRRYHQFGAAPNEGGGSGRSVFERPLDDWQDAQKRMNDFLGSVKKLHRDVKTGSDVLLDPLKELAALLGYKVEKV